MKILFAVSLLAIAAAAVLAFTTRSSFIDTRNEKDRLNRQILGIHEAVEKVNVQTDSVWGEWKSTKTLAKDEMTAYNVLLRETKTQEETLEKLKKEIDEIASKRAAMEAEIKSIIGREGTPEEVLAKVEALKGETDALNQEMATLQKELEVNKKAAADSDSLSAKLKAQQSARDAAIRLGASSATIAAVNQEFSFVVINMGRANGLTADTRLLVKREGQLLGHLKITVLEKNQTVADIDLKTLRPGVQIMPGDEVVFETTVQ
jgi:predicted RNase H-like nuclease (RuvC/YqgF family)